METKDQNIKYFYARNLVIFRIIFILIAMFFLLSIAPELWFNTVVFIIVLILLIVQYFMEYVIIDKDFISHQPGIARGKTSVLFDEVKSVRYDPKKVFIDYCNKITGEESTLKISLQVLKKDDRQEFLETLHTIFKDKEV